VDRSTSQQEERPLTDTASPPSELGGAPGRHETPIERLDRNLEELLAGLRVALPGVQVLFAFLLILPFQQRFEEVTAFQEKVYFATLLCTAAASVLLIAPSARHRIQFRRGDKAYVVLTANRLAIAGLAFLGLAMIGAILLISDYLFDGTVAAISTAVVGAGLGWAWFASPLSRRLRSG
jgi:positive regulator of sigma E activity